MATSAAFLYISFNQRRFAELIGVKTGFMQDNHSKSAKNVLRGSHYRIQQPQGKLVRVIAGVVFDAAVDIRKSSPSFSQWVGVTLSTDNKRQLWIPEGFAHGFVVTSASSEFLCKTTDYWAPEFERSILWNDPAIGIEWPVDAASLLSSTDKAGKLLAKAEVFG